MNTEATPLLAEQSWAIKPAAQTLRDHGLQGVFIQDIAPAFTINDPRKLGFVLCVLLYLRQNLIQQGHKDKEPYQRWSHEQTRKTDIDTIEDTIKDLWDLFLDIPRETQVIELILWQGFPLEEQKSQILRVVDFLIKSEASEYLAGHPVTVWTISEVWKRGVTALDRNTTAGASWAQRLDTCCSPRIVHLADTISDFLFLVLIIHFLNDPLQFPQGITGRETSIAILTFGGLFRYRSAHKLSYVVTTISFLSSIPDLPAPGQTPFMLLTIALALHIMELHLAQHPSPIYLLPVDWGLPLVVFLKGKLSQGIIPIVFYLSPVFLFSSYLLSLSLADTFLSIGHHNFTILAPAPFPTRVAYLIFSSSVVIIAAICTIILITLDNPKSAADRWDRYSSAVGHEARALWFRTVVTYSDRGLFPSPLTFMHLLQLLPRSSDVASHAQKLIRLFVVAPFALVLNLIYALLRI